MAETIVITPSEDVKKILADAGVKSVADEIKDIVVSKNVTEVSGEMFGCNCWGWHLALRKLHSPTVPAQPKTEEPVNTESK
jgi:hypothetical protein